jgi:hypothetical protein
VIKRPSLEAFLELDLSAIKFALALKPQGPKWSIARTESVEADYKKFLYLNAINPAREMVPSRDIDEFWHTHILDTQKYVEDCQILFGRYLHHFPYSGTGGEADAQNYQSLRAETDKLFVAEFGYSPLALEEGAMCKGSKDIGFEPSAECAVTRATVSQMYRHHLSCQTRRSSEMH